VLKRVILLILPIFCYLSVTGQNVTPTGKFLQDSILIGEPVPFVLSITYPQELEMVFPDSLYDFSPFELTRKEYFTTKSDSLLSTDSAIYYLSTFEIDTVQYLKLPVYQINSYDSSILWTITDEIVLNQVVTAIPDSVTMITNTTYLEVPMAFNYPYAIIGAALLIIILVVLLFFFGKPIKNRIHVYRLKKRHENFISSFDLLIKNDYLKSEEILTLWKSYLEKLKKSPFTKLTTKEIVIVLKNVTIETALTDIDKNIYGPKDSSLLENAYKVIKNLAIDEYNTKVNQILHG
jgi:hypothetical protein